MGGCRCQVAGFVLHLRVYLHGLFPFFEHINSYFLAHCDMHHPVVVDVDQIDIFCEGCACFDGRVRIIQFGDTCTATLVVVLAVVGVLLRWPSKGVVTYLSRPKKKDEGNREHGK